MTIKTLFLATFDPRLSTVKSVFDCRLSGVETVISTLTKIVSEYDQEIPQSQTADNPVAPRRRAAQPSRDTRKTN